VNCVYLSSVKEFVFQDSQQILQEFQRNFISIFGENPGIEQVSSWLSTVNFLKKVMNDPHFYPLFIAFEYRLPFSNERIDCILFGMNFHQKPALIVFEFKGWTRAEQKDSETIVECNLGKTVHPEYQLENYVGKIRFSHSEAENFEIYKAVLMYNAQQKHIQLLFNIPVFYRDDVLHIRQFIKNLLVKGINQSIVFSFINGYYRQSKRLFTAIKKHFTDIQKQSHYALAEKGWGLSAEQLQVVGKIIQDVQSGKRDVVYLVQGAPGSGKTLLAIHLLLTSLHRGYQSVLTYRNNRLINSIREVFNSVKQGLSDPIKFYSVGPNGGYTGLAEENYKGPYLDLVIYDEAQRMSKHNIAIAMRRARVAVFFYDENQILNSEEEGTRQNFIHEASIQGKFIKEEYLRGFYRVEGGQVYHRFVEKLLTNPEALHPGVVDAWRDKYEFKVLNDFEMLIRELKYKREEGFKVALIAAFTESKGQIRSD